MRGLRAALRFCLAVPIGWSLLLLLSAVGLGALVLAVPVAALGDQGARRRLPAVAGVEDSAVHTPRQADGAQLSVGFRQGVLLQFLNIKAWLLALTLVAGWIAGQPDALRRFAIVRR